MRNRTIPLCFLLLLTAVSGSIAPAGALAVSRTRALTYHGYRLAVPAGWPVYRLQSDPTACVRFDRHAVYLGRPSAAQRCPAHAAGRTEAVLVEPLQSHVTRAGGASGPVLPPASSSGGALAPGSSAQLVNSRVGVAVTATWSHHPAVIRHALGVRSVLAPPASSQRRPSPVVAAASARTRAGFRARTAIAVSGPAGVFTGLGFDACSAPSFAQMSAWSGSPYRAIGLYIGGTNMACSQANLTSSWVSQQSAAGWHLVPIYVGLQAPSNSCGCASISPASATSQGAAAALDAVARAQAIGLGAGNPLYADMEGYARSTGNSAAVLAFLASWTAQLHASGYLSGVYSSADSGIRDLVSQVGTSYAEPDDLWIARWNDAQNTSDTNVPAGDWPSHQRLHQYNGAHNETYGSVTLNIDGDYLDGATAAAAAVTPAVAVAPTLSIAPVADGAISLRPNWSGALGVSSWQILAGDTPTSLTSTVTAVSAGARMPIVIHSAFPYFAVRALGSAGQTLGTSVPVATPAHVAIFGRSAFVPRHGLGGLPVGCFTAAACNLTTTISAGHTTLARTGPERIPVGGGLVYFSLSPAARAQLSRARHHRLGVKVTVRDVSGVSASRRLSLIPFAVSGPSPRRGVSQSSTVRIIGTTDFVANGWLGGILAGCFGATPCQVRTTLVAGGRTIARSGREFLGVNELGYLLFSLTRAGHTLLMHNPGNQLSAKLTISTGSATATGRVALASFR